MDIEKKEPEKGIKKTKRNLIGWYVKYSSEVDKLWSGIYPFCVIMMFVIMLPSLKAVSIRYLSALIILVFVIKVGLDRIYKLWEKEATTAELIQANKDKISELNEDIKIMEKKLEKRKDLVKECKEKDIKIARIMTDQVNSPMECLNLAKDSIIKKEDKK